MRRSLLAGVAGIGQILPRYHDVALAGRAAHTTLDPVCTPRWDTHLKSGAVAALQRARCAMKRLIKCNLSSRFGCRQRACSPPGPLGSKP